MPICNLFRSGSPARGARLLTIFFASVWLAVAGVATAQTAAKKPAAAAAQKRPAIPPQRVPTHAAWTFMFYVDADNSLERSQLANVDEMLQIGSTDRVQFVTLCDRSDKSEPKDQYSDEPIGGLPNWSGAKLLHIEKGTLKQVADWGKTNMADPDTLKRFVAAAAKAYPADHYGLIIADHGTGWQAFCVDEGSDDQTMNLRQLRDALTDFVVDNGKLDIIGFDACLMGSFEVAQAVAPVARMMVGSEELAPGRGWNYDVLCKTLAGKPEMNAFDVGRTIIDAYTIHFNQSKDPFEQVSTLAVTLSMVDLDAFPELQTAVSALGDKCAGSLHNGKIGWIRVARPRAIAEEYGELGLHGEGGDEEMHDLMDLVQLMEAMGDPPLVEAAKQVDAQIRKTVKYFTRGSYRPRSGGISIYFPEDGIDIKEGDGEAYMRDTFARDAHWINLLSLYSTAVHDFGGEAKLFPLKSTGKVAEDGKPIVILSKLADPDFDKLYFVVQAHDGGDLLEIGRMPVIPGPDGTVGFRWSGGWFSLSNGKSLHTCPITMLEAIDPAQGSYLGHVPILILRDGSPKPIRAHCTLHIKIENGKPSAQFMYAFAASKQGPKQVRFQAGDRITPIYVRLTADGGEEEWTPNPERGLLLERPEDFRIDWQLLGRGFYKAGFELRNLAGHAALELDDFELK